MELGQLTFCEFFFYERQEGCDERQFVHLCKRSAKAALRPAWEVRIAFLRALRYVIAGCGEYAVSSAQEASPMGTFIGVYSSLLTGPQRGRGAGRRKQYWFVWDYGDEGYRVQELDAAFRAKGELLSMAHANFHASFTPEPSILAAPIRRPAFSGPLSQDVELGVAEQAAVENHLRAYFGAMLLKVRRGDDIARALQSLREIAEVEEGIVPAHKYMFADFGINLRKGKLPEIALEHAKRVLALAPGDSHAHFNIARIYHVLGKLGEAEQHLLSALEFSPDLGYARDFLAYIGKERHRKEFDARRAQRW